MISITSITPLYSQVPHKFFVKKVTSPKAVIKYTDRRPKEPARVFDARSNHFFNKITFGLCQNCKQWYSLRYLRIEFHISTIIT